VTADARPFLRRSTGRYDAIFIDAYRQPYIPFYLATREFFELVHKRLTADGVAVINVGHPEDSPELERTLGATMHAVFPSVMRDPMTRTNSLLIASRGSIHPQRLRAAALHPDVAKLARSAADRLAPRLPGGRVYTDDVAPVEWLVDRSIVGYAANEE
jgi:spermidine synthase